MLGYKAFAETPISSLINLNDANVGVTGQVGTGAVGSLSFITVVNFLVSQDTEEVAAATTAVGTITVLAASSLSVTGQSSTSALGSTTTSANALVDDYGNNPDEPLSALTASLAGIGVNGGVIAILPNLSATVGTVNVTIDAEANVSIPLADEGEGAVGSLSFVALCNFLVSQDTEDVGSLTTNVGTPTTIANSLTSVTGYETTSSLGTAITTANSDVPVTGLAATSGFTVATQRTSNTIVPTGYGMTGSVGEIIIDAKATVIPDSILGTSAISHVNVWSLVDDSQTAGYSNVDTSDSSSYSNINESQTPNWVEVA